MVNKYRITRRDGKAVISTTNEYLPPDKMVLIYTPSTGFIQPDCPEYDPIKLEHWNPQTKSWEVLVDKLADLDSLSGEIKDILGESRRKYRILFSNDNTWTVDSGSSPDEFAQRYRLMRDGPDLARVVEISVHDSGGGGHGGWSTIWNNSEELDELSGEIKGLLGESWWDNHQYRTIMKDGRKFRVSSMHAPKEFIKVYLGWNVKPPVARIEHLQDDDSWKVIWDAADNAEELSSEIKSLLR